MGKRSKKRKKGDKMSDLISRKEVEKAIKEFNKRRVDRVSNALGYEEHSKILDTILEENVELLAIINALPVVSD